MRQGGDRKRIGLSLNVGRLNGGGTDALHLGAVLPAAVKAVEDHGYSLTFGVKLSATMHPHLECPSGARPAHCRVAPCQSWWPRGVNFK